MFVNQQDESVVVPLNAELKCDAKLELANSFLSEFAVMAVSSPFGCAEEVGVTDALCGKFEYGVSWERPTILPIWEAQVRAGFSAGSSSY